jgi:chemotaxis signal transduction protein
MKFAATHQPRATAVPAAEAAIIFLVGGETYAIAASAVLEIGSTDGMSGVATPASHPNVPQVGHTLRRGRRIYYVVNGCTYFHLPPARPSMVLLLSASRTAVLVDRIERMSEVAGLLSLPPAFAGEERRWYRGLAVLGKRVVPVVNPASFLTSDEIALLESVGGGVYRKTSGSSGQVST